MAYSITPAGRAELRALYDSVRFLEDQEVMAYMEQRVPGSTGGNFSIGSFTMCMKTIAEDLRRAASGDFVCGPRYALVNALTDEQAAAGTREGHWFAMAWELVPP